MYSLRNSVVLVKTVIGSIAVIVAIANVACGSDAQKEPPPPVSSASIGRVEIPSRTPEVPIEVASPFRFKRVGTFPKPHIHNA